MEEYIRMATYAPALDYGRVKFGLYICLIDDRSVVQEGEGLEEEHPNRYNLPSWRGWREES
jgi:hypothetical protein